MSTNDPSPSVDSPDSADRETDTDREIDTEHTVEQGRDQPPADHDAVELAARIEVLSEENRRLRTEYARARQARYRRTAIGLLAVGLLAAVGGVVFTNGREVLFALGATGLFGGVLTYYLTPGRFIAATVGEHVYAAAASNQAAIADQLGLRSDRVYLPGDGSVPARLYVPQRAEYDRPAVRTDQPILVDESERGLLLEATGTGLFYELERTMTGDVSTDPFTLGTQLVDALVEQFELAERGDHTVEDDRLTVSLSGSAFGPLDRFDHPVPSFLAVGVATALERPVTLQVASGEDRADWLVTCRWDS